MANEELIQKIIEERKAKDEKFKRWVNKFLVSKAIHYSEIDDLRHYTKLNRVTAHEYMKNSTAIWDGADTVLEEDRYWINIDYLKSFINTRAGKYVITNIDYNYPKDKGWIFFHLEYPPEVKLLPNTINLEERK